MKLTAKFNSLMPFDDEMLVSFSVDNYRQMQLIKELEKDKRYSVEVKEIKSKRSIEQNRLLWALMHDIDVAVNGERSNDEWSVYIYCLERAGAKYEYIGCLPEAEEMLKENFRAVKFIKKIDLNGKDGHMYKCFIGSSRMNTKEMTLLIDTALDVAAEVGIETSYYMEMFDI